MPMTHEMQETDKTALRSEVRRLRSVLAEVVAMFDDNGDLHLPPYEVRDIARAALSQ